MAQKNYTYQFSGVQQAYLEQQVPGSGSRSDSVPVLLQTITWDETYKGDLDAAMASAGWSYSYEGTAPAAKTIAQIQSASLASDASAILVASGWVDVVSRDLTSLGGSTVAVQATAIGSPSVGVGQARVIVNGTGIPADTVIGAAAYDIQISSLSTTAFNAPTAVPSADPAVTYTFKIQMRATGILGQVVPCAGTRITLVEYK